MLFRPGGDEGRNAKGFLPRRGVLRLVFISTDNCLEGEMDKKKVRAPRDGNIF